MILAPLYALTKIGNIQVSRNVFHRENVNIFIKICIYLYENMSILILNNKIIIFVYLTIDILVIWIQVNNIVEIISIKNILTLKFGKYLLNL